MMAHDENEIKPDSDLLKRPQNSERGDWIPGWLAKNLPDGMKIHMRDCPYPEIYPRGWQIEGSITFKDSLLKNKIEFSVMGDRFCLGVDITQPRLPGLFFFLELVARLHDQFEKLKDREWFDLQEEMRRKKDRNRGGLE